MPRNHAQNDQFSSAKCFTNTEQKSIFQRANKVRTRLETEDAQRRVGERK